MKTLAPIGELLCVAEQVAAKLKSKASHDQLQALDVEIEHLRSCHQRLRDLRYALFCRDLVGIRRATWALRDLGAVYDSRHPNSLPVLTKQPADATPAEHGDNNACPPSVDTFLKT